MSNVESTVGEDRWIGESLKRLVYGSNEKRSSSRGTYCPVHYRPFGL
jgi:hypothetical protein